MNNIKTMASNNVHSLTKFIVKKQSALFMLLIILIALIWRVWDLSILPKNLSTNEINTLTKVFKLTYSPWSILPHDIFNAFYLFLFAGIAKLVGFNIFIFRITQALLGTLTVYLFYLFSKAWFNRQVALLSSLFLAVDAFHVALSRELAPSIMIILFFVLILYLITLSLRSNKVIYFILSGLVSAISLYVDKIFIFLPLIFVVTFIYFYKLNKKILTTYWKNYLVYAIIFLIASIPFLRYLPSNMSFLISAYNPGSVGQYFMNLGTAARSLFSESIPGQLYYVGLEPILSPFVAISLICGLIYAIFHLERRKYFFLVVLMVAVLGIISFSADKTALNYLLLLPISFILASVILDYFLAIWLKTFPYNKIARIALAFILSFFIFLNIYYNFEKYFYAWRGDNNIQKQFTHTLKIDTKKDNYLF